MAIHNQLYPKLTLFVHDFSADAESSEWLYSALCHNAELSAVHQIIVMGELPRASVLDRLPAAVAKKIEFVALDARPALPNLFDIANRSLASSGCEVACVMDAGVVFAQDADVIRLTQSILDISSIDKNALFALSRHDLLTGQFDDIVRDGLGLPSMVTTDAWVFAHPLCIEKNSTLPENGYSISQRLLSHLVAAGHNLYNPALDCKISYLPTHPTHGEGGMEKSANSHGPSISIEGKSRLTLQDSKSMQDGDLLGICPITTSSLSAGYRPRIVAAGKNATNAFIFLDSQIQDLDGQLQSLLGVARGARRNFFLVVEDHALFRTLLVKLAQLGEPNLFALQAFSNLSVLKRFFRGAGKQLSNFVCVQRFYDLKALDAEQFGAILVILSDSHLVEGASRQIFHVACLSAKVTDFVASCMFCVPNIIVNWADNTHDLYASKRRVKLLEGSP